MKRFFTARIIMGSIVFAIILELSHGVSGFWLKSLIASVAGVGGAFALARLRARVADAQCDWKNWMFGLRILLGGVAFGLLWTSSQTLSNPWFEVGTGGLGGAVLMLSAECWRRAPNR